MELDISKLKELKYCIRTKHSLDMPLKYPRMNCSFLEGKECSVHPAHLQYLAENGSFQIKMIGDVPKFRCVLFDEFGLSISEQRSLDKASKAIQKQELIQSKKDSKLLESIKNKVSILIFEDINYELEESVDDTDCKRCD